jgi:hypothetical protein
MPKTLQEFYETLPRKKQALLREVCFNNMARSTFYKILKEEFLPKPKIRQDIANFAQQQIIFGKKVYYPNKPIQEVIGHPNPLN